MKAVRRGEVWFADLGAPTGRELALKRPVVVIQNDDLGKLGTTVIIPTTTNLKKIGVRIMRGEGGLDKLSVAQAEHLRVLDIEKLLHKLGNLPGERLSEIEATLSFSLGLP